MPLIFPPHAPYSLKPQQIIRQPSACPFRTSTTKLCQFPLLSVVLNLPPLLHSQSARPGIQPQTTLGTSGSLRFHPYASCRRLNLNLCISLHIGPLVRLSIFVFSHRLQILKQGSPSLTNSKGQALRVRAAPSTLTYLPA